MQQRRCRGETRGSGLWGTGRGGQGSNGEGRKQSVRRGLLALLALTLAAPLAASAGGTGHGRAWRDSYLAPALSAPATQTPNETVPVIVQSTDGAAERRARSRLLDARTRADHRRRRGRRGRRGRSAGPRPTAQPRDHARPDGRLRRQAGPLPRARRIRTNPPGAVQLLRDWPAAVGVDQLWPDLPHGRHSAQGPGHDPPSRSWTRASRPRPATSATACSPYVNLTPWPDNSPGDGRGHGTFVAGIAAGAARTSPAPRRWPDRLDRVMNDQGMATTSDVIAAANGSSTTRRYNIRVANFSLHSATPTASAGPARQGGREALVHGVVVVAAAGNYGTGGPSGVRYARRTTHS